MPSLIATWRHLIFLCHDIPIMSMMQGQYFWSNLSNKLNYLMSISKPSHLLCVIFFMCKKHVKCGKVKAQKAAEAGELLRLLRHVAVTPLTMYAARRVGLLYWRNWKSANKARPKDTTALALKPQEKLYERAGWLGHKISAWERDCGSHNVYRNYQEVRNTSSHITRFCLLNFKHQHFC